MGNVVRLADHRPDAAFRAEHPTRGHVAPPMARARALKDAACQARARAEWLQVEAQLLISEAHYLLRERSQQTRAQIRRARSRSAGSLR